MSRAALDGLLYMQDEAFAGDDWHSLLSNIKDVTHRRLALGPARRAPRPVDLRESSLLTA
jgi:hypothetical protein